MREDKHKTGNNMTADKQDIQRLDTKIDALQERYMAGQEKLTDSLQTLTKEVTRLATIVETIPRPETRPCKYFESHMKEHELARSPLTLRAEFDAHIEEHEKTDAKNNERGLIWYAALVSFVFNIVFSIGTVSYHFLHKENTNSATQVVAPK